MLPISSVRTQQQRFRRPAPRVTWFWGDSVDLVDKRMRAHLHTVWTATNNTWPCGWLSARPMMERVQYAISSRGGDFPTKILLVDDFVVNDFSRMSPRELRKLLKPLLSPYNIVTGPHNLARRRVPNSLLHVVITSRISPANILTRAEMSTADVNVIHVLRAGSH